MIFFCKVVLPGGTRFTEVEVVGGMEVEEKVEEVEVEEEVKVVAG